MDPDDLVTERLLEETGVAILPGTDFGRPPDELTARISYVDFDGAEALRAAAEASSDQDLDASFARRHCPRPVDGVERLAAWLMKTNQPKHVP
jgi:aspartate aminotransferase